MWSGGSQKQPLSGAAASDSRVPKRNKEAETTSDQVEGHLGILCGLGAQGKGSVGS